MESTLNVATVLQQVQDRAEKIKNDETQQFPEAANAGDCWVQGDVYITLLEALPADVVKITKPEKQLAPGTTQGSRHCLDALAGVTVYRLPNPGMLDGPVIRCLKERTITHPEHGDVVLPPGIYQISYQRDLDAENRERRVQD
jgi:hypothetical protein